MKKMFFCTISLLLAVFTVTAQEIPVAAYWPAQLNKDSQNTPITVQYPHEKMTVARGAKNIYLFGKINLPTPSLRINGQSVTVFKEGTFIAFVPVEQGDFPLLLEAVSDGKTYQAIRNIIVPGTPIQAFTKKARFDEKEVYPRQPLWALPGDYIHLSVRGTPNAHVTAKISGISHKKIELTEDPLHAGLYQGQYTLKKDEEPRTAKITYFLHDPNTNTKTKIRAPEKLKILDPNAPLQPAWVKDAGTKMRKIPVHQGSLHSHYRAFGNVLINGRDRGLFRVQLSDHKHAWLEEKKLKLFSWQEYQPNTLKDLHTHSQTQQTQVRFEHTHKTPIAIQEFNNRIEVTFFYTSLFEENFNFDATSALLNRIEWEETSPNTLKFTLFFKENQNLWGYAYRYEKNDFILELNHPPLLTPSPQQPLAGARILLDAGHSPKRTPPYDGLVTPSGLLEYELNLQLAEILKPKLEKAGATVILTRQGNNHMSLPARYKKALQEKAHLFISLHFNALPETTNPLEKPLGYSVYYAYPHSFKLAESIHKSFNKKIPLPDSGLIVNDVLFIPRIPDMPSVLIENAYPILPEQEAFSKSKEGQALFADAIYQAIIDFFQSAATAR